MLPTSTRRGFLATSVGASWATAESAFGWSASTKVSKRSIGAPSRKELRLSTFGGVNDGSGDGRGTDNTIALQRLLTAASSGEFGRIIIEPGVYCFDGTLAAIGNITDLMFEGWGAALIGRKAAAQPGDHFVRIRNSRDAGGHLSLGGLELAMARPSVRTPNVDMLLIEGFRSVLLDEVSVPCADNMGVSFDRASKPGWIPEEIIGRNLEIGGRTFDRLHSHASIGDSGIWIPRGAKRIDITARIRSTGDDACYLGPIPVRDGEPVAKASFRLHLDTFQTASGFHVEMPNGVLTGRVDTTLTAAIACTPALNGAPSNRIDNLRIDVEIKNAGMIEPGMTGEQTIPRVNSCGVWLYGAGENIDLTGTTMCRVRGPGLLLQAAEGQVLRRVRGDVKMRQVMIGASGRPLGGDGAAVKRSATGKGVVRDVSLTLDLHNCACPVISWLQTSALNDENLRLGTRLYDHKLDQRAYPGKALANFFAIGAGRVRQVAVNFETHGGTAPAQWVSVAGGNRLADIVLKKNPPPAGKPRRVRADTRSYPAKTAE